MEGDFVKGTQEWYKSRHDELLGYLKEAVEVAQPQRHEEALKAVEEKCREDQFDVVLLGGFQDGKSTTLDVLCGGRELSPQGKGTKATSAVPISVEAILGDDAKEEWAELRFKDDAQIKDEFFNAFEVAIASNEGSATAVLKRFVQGSDDVPRRDRFREQFDLQNPEHVGVIRELVAAEWEKYAAHRDSLGTHHRQLLEVVTIYLKYYGTEEYRKLVAKTTMSVQDIGQYVYFPSDWQNRTPSGLDFDLTFAECSFAFLDSVILHLHSRFLSQLNCRVTDCPGLGASAYDQDVAKRALMRADGVWYVKECKKMLGSSDLGNIFDLVKNNGRLDRTGMALNLKLDYNTSLHDTSASDKCLVNHCKGQLEKDGFKFPVFWCNARLAYMAELGRRKYETKEPFSPSEREWLKRIIPEFKRKPNWSDEELWVVSVEWANNVCQVSEIAQISEFAPASFDLLWKYSNMDAAVEVMSKIVLEQKGHAILIDNGSKRAFDILKCYERELQLVEDNAQRAADEVSAELDRARVRMDQFVSEAENLKQSSNLVQKRSELENDFTEAFINYVFGRDFVGQFANACAWKVFALNNAGYKDRDEFANKFAADVNPILLNVIEERRNSFLSEKWRPDSSVVAVYRFFEEVDSLKEGLAGLLEKLEEEGDIFDDLPIPLLGCANATSIDVRNMAKKMAPIVESMRVDWLDGVLGIIKWILTLGGLLEWLIKNIPIVGTIFGPLFGKSDKEKVQEIRNKIWPKIDEFFGSKKFRNELKSFAAPMFDGAVDSLMSDFDAGIDVAKETFDARCADLEVANAASEEEKRAIAAKNNKIRTEKVQPIREKLERFEKAVEEELQQCKR